MTRKPLDIKITNTWTEFEGKDPWNHNNRIKGYICRAPSTKYGMLKITHVNDRKAPQWIWSAPKMHYPFDYDGNWKWTGDISGIEVYEKLDGTAIIHYSYYDADGKEYKTFKTRQTPVISEEKGYSFVYRMTRMIEKYPHIHKMLDMNPDMDCLVYELYGKHNKHIILYDIDLDLNTLFGRDEEGNIYSPKNLACNIINPVPFITDIEGNKPGGYYTKKHNEIVEYLEKNINVDKIDDEIENDIVKGMEGAMMYVKRRGTFQYKIKPEYIRDRHWATGEHGIPSYSIYVTIINAFEETDEPTTERIIEMLEEEFESDKVYKKMRTIKKLYEKVRSEQVIRNDMAMEYIEKNKEDPDFDITTDRGKVMRYFASNLDTYGISKKYAPKIYTILSEMFG